MKPSLFYLAATSLVLVAVVATSNAGARSRHVMKPAPNAMGELSAEGKIILNDLIVRGYVVVDPATGKLHLKQSVVTVLQQYGMMPLDAYVGGPCCDAAPLTDVL